MFLGRGPPPRNALDVLEALTVVTVFVVCLLSRGQHPGASALRVGGVLSRSVVWPRSTAQ